MVCAVDIIKESLSAYCADDMPRFKTVVGFECRGVEPTDFEPRVCFLFNCVNVECSAIVHKNRLNSYALVCHVKYSASTKAPFHQRELTLTVGFLRILTSS